jgi:hypothetical protein
MRCRAWHCCHIITSDGAADVVAAERSRDRVRAASYGTVLVITALAVTSITAVDLGHSAELVLGVGAATWLAHLYAELLSRHVVERSPMRRGAALMTALDSGPIVLATVLPALALFVGRADLLSASTARTLAIVVAVAQLTAICTYVARVAPYQRRTVWLFAVATATIGLAVGVAAVILGH